MRHTQYGKPDGNQRGIVRALRKVGASVAITTGVGGGFVDLVVGFRKRNTLLELKRPGEKLNEAEQKFHDGWRGAGPVVVETEEEALRVIGAFGPATHVETCVTRSSYVAPEMTEPHPSPLYDGLNRLAREDARKRGGKP